MIKRIRDKALARPFAVLAVCVMGFLIIRNVIGGSPFKTFPAEEHLSSGQRVSATGYLNKIEFSKGKSALYLRDVTVSYDSKEYPAGCVILNIKEEADFHIGSFIKAYGKAYVLEHGTNPGEFDEYNYYKSIGVDLLLEGEVEDEDEDSASKFLTFLSRIRRALSANIDDSFLKEDEGAVLKAMVLGNKFIQECGNNTPDKYLGPAYINHRNGDIQASSKTKMHLWRGRDHIGPCNGGICADDRIRCILKEGADCIYCSAWG